jgi:hypothetical protein
MKITKIGLLLLIIFSTSISFCYSQTGNDTLKQILSSKTFSLEEEYIGDWGGYIHIFNFSTENNTVQVKCKNPKLIKNEKELDVLLSLNDIKKLENIFTDCYAKILNTKNASTEHIFYKFKNKEFTYIIDDKFTMECNEIFKAWKEMLLIKTE